MSWFSSIFRIIISECLLKPSTWKKTYHNWTPCWNPISKVAFLLLDSRILIFTIAGIFQDVIGMQKSKEPPSPSIPQSYRVFHNLPQCHFQDVTPLPAFVCPIKTVPKNSLDLWTNLVYVCVRQVVLVQFYTIFQVDVSLKGIVVLLENRKLALNKSNQSSCQYDTCLGHCSKRYLDSGYI